MTASATGLAFIAAAITLCLSWPTLAATPQDCLSRFPNDSAQRLQCYDDLARGGAPAAATESSAPIPVTSVPSQAPAQTLTDRRPPSSLLHRDWNLTSDEDLPHTVFGIQPYKLNYVLFAHWSENPNRLPSSPQAGHTPLGPEDIDSTEVKFQFSVKSQILGDDDAKFLNFAGFDKYRVWFAYTQQSVWQAYNSRNSAPFRDSVYEPEIILTLGRPEGAPFKAFKLVNIGFNHQSNGRSDPYSRSWWRIYGQGGFEFGDFTVLARAWWRVPENRLVDDNPDIEDYTGRGDIAVRWERNGYAVGLLLRNNLAFSPNRGFMQADVSVPWLSQWLGLQNVQLHFQVASGYGESLIDYNHRQTSFGIGFALGDSKQQRP